MKGPKINFVLFSAFLFISSLIAGKVIADNEMAAPQNQEASAQMMDPKMAAMMEKMKEYSTPNENHKVLQALAGNWDYKLSMWMSPDAKPEESSGTSSNEWIMDGRFLQQNVSGTSMGQPFSGMGLIGYDNLKKTYQTVWLDSMGTGMMTGASSFDADKKVFSESGHMSCPMIGGDRAYRTVTALKDNDHYSYEMYMTDPESNKEFKTMEINYTRK